MIRVGQRADRQVPCSIPAEPSLVEQDTHQFGNCQSRVGVVHLNGSLLGKGVPLVVSPSEAGDDIGQRTGDQEVFLHKAERLTSNRGIIRV